MRFRTLALALALACGFGTLAEAKRKIVTPKHQKVKVTKHKNNALKARKVKRVKVRPANH